MSRVEVGQRWVQHRLEYVYIIITRIEEDNYVYYDYYT